MKGFEITGMRQAAAEIAVFSAAAIIFIISYFLQFFIYSKNLFADGWDSYFYLIQIKSVIETGVMHSPDISPVYRLMILIYRYDGDYLHSYKIACALISAMFVMSLAVLSFAMQKVFWEGKYVKNTVINSLTAGAFALFSPSLIFVAGQFPKNMLGFVFFNFFLIFFVNAVDAHRQPNAEKPVKAGVCFFLCLVSAFLAVVTHRFTAVLTVALALFSFGWYVLKKTTASGNRNFPKNKNPEKSVFIKPSLVFMTGIFMASAAVFLLSFFAPGVLHSADLSRFSGLMQSQPQITPLSFLKLLGTDKFSILWKAELLVVYASFVLIVLVSLLRISSSILSAIRNAVPVSDIFSRNNTPAAAVIAAFLIFLFPFYRIDATGAGYRFYSAFLIYSPLLFVFLPHKLTSMKISAAFPLLWLAFSFHTAAEFDFTSFNPPYQEYSLLAARVQSVLPGKKCELVVAHKALAEIFTFTTGIDALPWKPEKRFNPEKVWRIAHDAQPEKIIYYTDETAGENVIPLTSRYCLVREDVWDRYMQLLSYDRPDDFISLMTWMNPHEVRPQFITEKRNYEQ